ncbi:hypothetical protein M2480_002239 [Parabacteroides sp. PFB2-12]|uniref:hypothetical protein n=1 Tax=unclassified Parabacteroides TaxID=2649774 RepID=UPI00247577DC|nr:MULTISPECIES: hypothetical protein [unclassified Parabacteroides]MDH6343886.1 hypothetical protein [Parabacteroides sp. PM6-13]MDH6391248.1 hypothetical protein [Parabacteroides sp. PFB2-12]MDL2310009.1 hypothetical protein [Parabacteroides sp. OttesenSCG-928-B22]
MRIVFLPEALDYFNELTTILFEKDYFGMEDSALRYVDELLYDIKTTLPNRPKRKAPAYFEQFGDGMYYATFRKNKTTQWVVFFTIYQDKEDLVYLIRYISNNHVIAHFL